MRHTQTFAPFDLGASAIQQAESYSRVCLVRRARMPDIDRPRGHVSPTGHLPATPDEGTTRPDQEPRPAVCPSPPAQTPRAPLAADQPRQRTPHLDHPHRQASPRRPTCRRRRRKRLRDRQTRAGPALRHPTRRQPVLLNSDMGVGGWRACQFRLHRPRCRGLTATSVVVGGVRSQGRDARKMGLAVLHELGVGSFPHEGSELCRVGDVDGLQPHVRLGCA